MKRKALYAFAVVISLVCWVFFLFTGNLYLNSDNTDVALIINGYYGSPLSQYQHPILCLAINALSPILPSADVYTLLIHILIFFELILLLLILTEPPFQKELHAWKLNEYLTIMLSILVAVFFSAGLKLWQVNYTIQAASFIFTGWLTLLHAMRKQKKKAWIIIGTIFTAIGYMLRKEAGQLFIPFVLLMIAHEILVADKRRMAWKAVGRYLVPSCLVTVLLFTSQTIFTAVEPYATADRYNGARTSMVDFPIATWDESFENVSKVDYLAVSNWVLADTEVITVDSLEVMKAAGARNKYTLSPDGFRGAFSDMGRILVKTDVYLTVTALLTTLLTVWNTIVRRNKWSRLTAVCGFLGAFIIMLYFTFRGRALINVWSSVLLALLYLETIIALLHRTGQKPTILALILSVVLYYSAGQVLAHVHFHSFQTVLTSRIECNDDAYAGTYHNDDLYIWPLWNTSVLRDSWDSGKLPSKHFIEHNIPLGDWMYGQPYYTAFLERIVHPNPIRDLVEKDNVYIMTNGDIILNFLREHYGSDIDLVEAGEVNGVMAYKVEKGE